MAYRLECMQIKLQVLGSNPRTCSIFIEDGESLEIRNPSRIGDTGAVGTSGLTTVQYASGSGTAEMAAEQLERVPIYQVYCGTLDMHGTKE